MIIYIHLDFGIHPERKSGMERNTVPVYIRTIFSIGGDVGTEGHITFCVQIGDKQSDPLGSLEEVAKVLADHAREKGESTVYVCDTSSDGEVSFFAVGGRPTGIVTTLLPMSTASRIELCRALLREQEGS
jgi:hypothetical protein